MLANAVTLTRLLLTFAVITILGGYLTLDIALIAMIALIFILDALDGSVARRRNETSKLVAVLDTLSDRIIENTLTVGFCLLRGLLTLRDIYKTIRKRNTDAKRLFPIPQSTKKLTQPEISKKAVR